MSTTTANMPNITMTTTVNQRGSTLSQLRAADAALHDHSSFYYKEYEPFIDDSLNPHFAAYGLIKAYFNLKGLNNLPLYSGFMAMHLPRQNRSRHKVTFMQPINDDPNQKETAYACMNDLKKMVIDKDLQNDAILVVDEKIFRLCIGIKDEHLDEFDGIFLYPGDFHMMKCGMVVIWNILEESGIDTLFGSLYKGCTLTAVLTVGHFNKSLRAVKLLYTSLVILLNNEFLSSLLPDQLVEIDRIMNDMPNNFDDPQQNKDWYSSVLDFLRQFKFQERFDLWMNANCEKNRKFRFWTFVVFDLITPLLKLYTAIRTSNFSVRNSAVCDLAELFFATNHRQYARLTARHLSDLRVCSENLLNFLSNGFAVSRSDRNFSSIALDQTIEVTINKMGKIHGGITGRCSTDSIDIWSNSYTYRSLLSSITNELVGIESNYNSIDGHTECSPTRMEDDSVDLKILLDTLIEEKIFSLDNDNVTQLFTGKIIHPDIIESNCQSRKIGRDALQQYIHERLVTHTVPLQQTLKASALVRIRDNDPYDNSVSNIGKRRQKNVLDLRKVDADIRRVLMLAQYRSIDMQKVFGYEFSFKPISLCSLEDPNLLNQQSKSKDTIDFLKGKFPSAFSSFLQPKPVQSKALVIDGSSLLHVSPRHGATVYDYSISLLEEQIIPKFVDFDRIDLIFDTSGSKEVKSFIARHSHTKKNEQKYDVIPRNSILQNGKNYQKFVVENRARLAATVADCWKETQVVHMLPPGKVFVIAGPKETATRLERDQMPMDMLELESNQIEADTRIILHVDQLIQESYANIVIKSIDCDVMMLCIYFAFLAGLDHLVVDATIPKKQHKFVDCTYIHNVLIDHYRIHPKVLLIVYALSGCDTCSFVRNIGKKTFFQQLFDNPNDYKELEKISSQLDSIEDIAAAELLLIRCFQSKQNRKNVHSSTNNVNNSSSAISSVQSLDALRASIAMGSLKQNKASIAIYLPPTTDAWFFHCLRVSRQVQIWLQAPDGYIMYPEMNTIGFETIDGTTRIRWTSKPSLLNDPELSCCGKHKGACVKCICIRSQLPCTIFCQCSIDCPNRLINRTSSSESQRLVAGVNQSSKKTAGDKPLITNQVIDDESTDESVPDEASLSNGDFINNTLDQSNFRMPLSFDDEDSQESTFSHL